MVFEKKVQLGRVVYVAKGKHEGKLAVIVNIIDNNRALVDSGDATMPRCVMNFKDLQLTRILSNKIRFNQRNGSVKKVWNDEKINEKWSSSTWAKKIAKRALRANMNDFDRFKLFKAKQTRNRIIRLEMASIKRKGAPSKHKKAKAAAPKKPAAKK